MFILVFDKRAFQNYIFFQIIEHISRMVTEIYTLALFFVDSEDFSYCLVVTYNIKERPNLDPTIVVDLLTIQLTHFFTPPSYHYYRLLLPQLTTITSTTQKDHKRSFLTDFWLPKDGLDPNYQTRPGLGIIRFLVNSIDVQLYFSYCCRFLCSVFYFLAPHCAIKSEKTKSAIFLEESLA